MTFSELDLLATYAYRDRRPQLVDVGAHHGWVSRTFAAKGWRVLAFEPEEKNRRAFERHLADYPQVVCLARAVADVTGARLPFYVSTEHYGIHSLQPFHATHQLAYEVETVRLEDALAIAGIDRVTFLKIDIEGADFLALQGFPFVRDRPEVVMVEFMDARSQPHFGYSHHDVVAFMGQWDYAAFVSEWAPIQAYGREGQTSEPHTWLRCVPYPLDAPPAWGNLIFVPNADRQKFANHLHAYLQRQRSRFHRLVNWWA